MLKGNNRHTPPRLKCATRGSLPTRQQGLSLIELLIGITVGLIILAGTVAVVSKTTFSGLENVRAVQLDQQIRGTLGVIHRELQRAGYVNALDPTPAVADPGLLDYIDIDAVSLFGQVTLAGNCDAAGVCDCILYSYDRDEDGVQGDGTLGTTYELYGFRLSNEAIQMRVSGGSATACDGNWQAITDPSVRVTTLTFQHGIVETTTPDPDFYYDGTNDGIRVYTARDEGEDSCTPSASPTTIGPTCVCGAGDTCLAKRKINVVVAAELASDAAVRVRMVNQVSIKNHHYYDFPAP